MKLKDYKWLFYGLAEREDLTVFINGNPYSTIDIFTVLEDRITSNPIYYFELTEMEKNNLELSEIHLFVKYIFEKEYTDNDFFFQDLMYLFSQYLVQNGYAKYWIAVLKDDMLMNHFRYKSYDRYVLLQRFLRDQTEFYGEWKDTIDWDNFIIEPGLEKRIAIKGRNLPKYYAFYHLIRVNLDQVPDLPKANAGLWNKKEIMKIGVSEYKVETPSFGQSFYKAVTDVDNIKCVQSSSFDKEMISALNEISVQLGNKEVTDFLNNLRN